MPLSPIGRVCFRGDSRSPDDIFVKGFKLREIITENLFKKIKEMHQNHLAINSRQFNPQKFTEDMDALSEIIKTEATEGLIEEFSGLPSFLYDTWVNRVIHKVTQGAIVVTEDENKADLIKGIYRPFESQNFISVSKRFKSAILFPVPESLADTPPMQDNTYLYALYVEEGFDVHMQGIVSSLVNADTSESGLLSAFKKASPYLNEQQVNLHIQKLTTIQNIMNTHLEDAMKIYAEEIACESIPREHIIAAIKVERQLTLNDENQPCGTFKLKTGVSVNDQCTQPLQAVKQIEAFLKEEVRINQQAHKQGTNAVAKTLPQPEEGFTPVLVRV